MCDFHSCVIRADGALAHVAGNSHSEAVKAAGWAENRPHARPCFVEAEWDGVGEYPGADKICRVPDGEKLTAKQRETCDRHYKALADVMNNAKPSARSLARFAGPEFSDVTLARLTAQKNMPETLRYLVKRALDYVPASFAARVIEAWDAEKDYSMVWPRFSLWMLTDPRAGVIRFAKTDRVRDAINGVVALYARWIETGKKPDIEEWRKVRAAAYAAAYAAAAAAYAADAAAAYAYAADAAAYAAYAYAADAAAYAYAADARKSHWLTMSEKLLEIIKVTK